jgi:DNA-binding transcriptional ArsR family regulator
MRRAARIFKGLGHPSRIELACRLALKGPATQHELLRELGWPQSSLARHVGTMRERGLIRTERRGAEVVLALDGTVTPALLRAVCAWVHPETGEEFASRLPA